MKKNLRFNLILCGMMSVFFSQSAVAMEQTFYKWEDKEGSTHYTLTPPPKGAKSLGKMQTYRDFSPSPHRLMPQQESHKVDVPEEQKNENEQSGEQNNSTSPVPSTPSTTPQMPIMRPIVPQVPASQLPLTIKQNGREYVPLPR